MRLGQRIGLDDQCRSRSAVVARRGDGDGIAALHLASNSETASIHLIASSSRSGLKRATSLATRRVFATRNRALQLRYLVRLYVKELALKNFTRPLAEQLLERMVELSLYAEEKLKSG